MKNNIIMWEEADRIKRVELQNALRSATAPIQESMKWFEWEGDCLTCGPDTLEKGKEHWRNLYFYLSGYGDAQYQFQPGNGRQQPVAIPQGPTA